MSQTVLSIIESPRHPNLGAVYQRLGLKQVAVNSIRKANSSLKQQVPDIVVAEFLYGYGNNYSGVHISNLDVFLVSLMKYKPDAKVIVMVDKLEREYVDKLNEIYPLHTVLVQPVSASDIERELKVLLGND